MGSRLQRLRRRSERGSFAVELAILAPVILAFLLIIVDGGQLTWARSRLQGVARDTARAVTISHSTGGGAYDAANQAMLNALGNSGVNCRAPTLVLTPDPRDVAIGNGQMVQATVTCQVKFAFFGYQTITRSQQSVVDVYRQVTTGPGAGAGPRGGGGGPPGIEPPGPVVP